MSDTAPGPLLDSERTELRRFCGYPAFGAGASGFQSWRFFSAYGVLEYRLSNLSNNEVAVARTYIGQLQALELGVIGSAANLDTEQAAAWHRNVNETTDRTRLFQDWRRRLAAFIGVPPGPDLLTPNAIVV